MNKIKMFDFWEQVVLYTLYTDILLTCFGKSVFYFAHILSDMCNINRNLLIKTQELDSKTIANEIYLM